jgi:ribosomal-protein-alanine N-acetyltransferase
LIGEREYWGKGIMFETYSLLINHAFNILNLNKIIAAAPIVNVQSIVTLKKLGFSNEATFREQFFIDGKYIDLLVFGLLRSEFMANKE